MPENYTPRKGDRVRVVLEGEVYHSGYSTFDMGPFDTYGVNTINRDDKHIVSVERLPDPEPEWQTDDHVLDASGEVWRRSLDGGWFFAGSTGDKYQDEDVPRPLTLIVRGGKAVSGG